MKRRVGFSLIELVLAIGLSIALVALLGFAINLHLLRLETSQSTVEQAQVARAILDRIADDLRAATTAPTQDVSELMAAAEASAQFDVDEVDQIDFEGDTDEGGVDDTVLPGVNGGPDSIAIDRRVMRQTLSMPEEATAPIARASAGWVRVNYGLSAVAEKPGLIRTESSREAALWREQQGQPAPIAEPIAQEVRSVSFRYFQAEEGLELWDMQEAEALPIAVEVRLTLAPADAVEDRNAPEERRRTRTYRRLIRLPAAELDAADEASDSSLEGV